jgi:hypothetical protein
MDVAKEERHMAAVRARFPDRPDAELRRFCRARPKSSRDAIKMLEDYLVWRAGPGAPDSLARAAAAVPSEWLRPCGVAKDGSLVALCEGARYDPNIEPGVYCLAAAFLLDSLAGAADATRFTLLVDVRGGPGWPNPAPQKLIPFFKAANQMFGQNFPERAQRVVLYPVPSVMKYLWNMLIVILDPVTKEKFVIITGSHEESSKEQWLPEVAALVALEQLPHDSWARHNVVPSPISAQHQPAENALTAASSTG